MDDQATLDAVQRQLKAWGVGANAAPSAAQKILTITSTHTHTGPLPTAREFAGYEQICPGAARDILGMAMKEQDHRHAMDGRELKIISFLQALGVMAAIACVGGMIGAGVYLAIHDKTVAAGIALGGTGIAAVVTAFMRQGNANKADEPKPKGKARKQRGR